MASRSGSRSRATSIRVDEINQDRHRSFEPHNLDSVESSKQLSVWALSLAVCALALAAFVYFGCRDALGAAGILASVAMIIAVFLSITPGQRA